MPHERIESTINLAMGMRKNGGPEVRVCGFSVGHFCSFGPLKSRPNAIAKSGEQRASVPVSKSRHVASRTPPSDDS